MLSIERALLLNKNFIWDTPDCLNVFSGDGDTIELWSYILVRLKIFFHTTRFKFTPINNGLVSTQIPFLLKILSLFLKTSGLILISLFTSSET